MKKALTIFSFIMCNFALLAQGNGSENPNDSIIGTWIMRSYMGIPKPEDEKVYLIIKNDNTAIEKNEMGEYKRTWAIFDKEFCLKTLKEYGGIENCSTYKIIGDKLIIMEDSSEMIYEREL